MSEDKQATDETQVRKLIDERVKAVQTKDINRLMSNYAPELVEFDAINPLQYRGLAEVRKRAENWFASYQGSIGYEVRDLSITMDTNLAFCHFLYHISGTMTTGSEVSMWLRDTVCYRRVDGKWLVTHEHTSVPFDGETGQASVALKP